MTKSQHKKYLARLFNLRRDERLAYEMDRQLFPAPKTTHKQRMKNRQCRLSQVSLMAGIALAVSIEG